MKAHIFCMLVVMLPLHIQIAGAQQSGRRSAMYQSWIQTRDGSPRIRGILYAVGDSAIYVSDALSRQSYERGDFEVMRIDYSDIERIQVRHSNSLSAGILSGAVIGGGIILLALRSNMGNEWGTLIAFVLVPPFAAVGGAVGGIVGGMKTSFPVHGDYARFADLRNRLNIYTFVKDTIGALMPQREEWIAPEVQDPEQLTVAVKHESSPLTGFFTAFSIGPVFPAADFADSRASNPKSGYAGVGPARNLLLGYDPPNSFLFTLQGAIHEYNLSRKKINKWMDVWEERFHEQEYTYFSDMLWRIYSISAGFSYAVPIREKWYAEMQLQLGYAYSRFRGDMYILQKGEGPSYGFHTLLRYDRTPRWSILLDAGYFISTQEMTYNFTQPGIKTRELQGYSLQGGMLYRF